MDERDEVGRPKTWFRAKASGWGWDMPTCWQGWAVLLGYVGLMFGLAQVVKWTPGFVAIALALTTGLIVICWWKGEKPRGRGPRVR